jgi:tRNA-specific 2-thiouridylase
VVAALLKRDGYDVIGVTLQLYDHGVAINKAGACCAGQDIHDARRVADRLGIPHYVLDYESRFRDAVMEDFADSYLAGETPIPCVKCNQNVKFKDLLALARDLGADCLATGHYVQRVVGDDGAELHRAHDPGRDQSYFLFATTRAQLDYLRFPLGHMPKSETRALAATFGLEVADKPDSQDICFVPTGKYADVVAKLRPGAIDPGEIVHVDGRVLGRHDGIINFTVGQRRGLGVAAGAPLFVVKLDAAAKRVIVGPREALLVTRMALKDVNWIGEAVATEDGLHGRRVLVRVRSTRPPVPGTLDTRAGWFVDLDAPEEGVAPGQAAVFYDAENPARVLGGGWIARTV